MHISEGVLSAPVLISGGVLAAAGTSVGLKKLDYDKIPTAAILASAFFVASLIHFNIGPSSVHLTLNGIVGLFLGWAAVPVILVALTLQSVFFQFGGITALGVNTVAQALPAVICHYLFRNLIWKGKTSVAAAAGFGCGFISISLACILVALALVFTHESFIEVSWMILAANSPVMVIEGFITMVCIGFIKKVRPELLPGYLPKENNQHG
jgi:cobalt/nickel transport system permease protein